MELRRQFGWCRRLERQGDHFGRARRKGRAGAAAGARLVDGLVAGDAAVEAGHIGKIVVQGELRQPDLLDLQRAVERVDDRQIERLLGQAVPMGAVGQVAILLGLLQEDDLVQVIVERLSRRGDLDRGLAQDCLLYTSDAADE